MMRSTQQEADQQQQDYTFFLMNFEPLHGHKVHELCELLSWKIFTITSNKELTLSHQYVEVSKLQTFLRGISSTSLSHLNLDYNWSSKLLRLITCISFSNLQTLSLSGNRINSLETLQLLNGTSLNLLILDDNQFCHLKPFQKVTLPVLKVLSLNLTKIKHFQSYLTKINSPSLHTLEISDHIMRGVDITFAMKFQSNYSTLFKKSTFLINSLYGVNSNIPVLSLNASCQKMLLHKFVKSY